MDGRHISVCSEQAKEIVRAFGFKTVCVLAEREERQAGSVQREVVGVLAIGSQQELDGLEWLAELECYEVPQKLRSLYKQAILANGLEEFVAWDNYKCLWGTELVLQAIRSEAALLSHSVLH